MSKRKLTRDQLSTLLYLETRLVDHGGRVNAVHMNADDMAWARHMNDEGFIGFGRIVMQDHNRDGSNWVTFSDEAWEISHRERRARADRRQAKRTFRTTKEASSRVDDSVIALIEAECEIAEIVSEVTRKATP